MSRTLRVVLLSTYEATKMKEVKSNPAICAPALSSACMLSLARKGDYPTRPASFQLSGREREPVPTMRLKMKMPPTAYLRPRVCSPSELQSSPSLLRYIERTQRKTQEPERPFAWSREGRKKHPTFQDEKSQRSERNPPRFYCIEHRKQFSSEILLPRIIHLITTEFDTFSKR